MRKASGSAARRGPRGRSFFGRGPALEALEGRSLLSTASVTLGDFDGDGRSDVAIYDVSTSAFYVRLSSPSGPATLNGGQPIAMGNPAHSNVSAVGDYDGDGKADLAIYDQTVGAFYVRESSTGYSTALNNGQPIYMGNPSHLNVPVVGDFDGDGKADLAIYDETVGAFYVRLSSTNYSTALNGGQPIYMGNPNHIDIPVSGDFDDDGKTDLAIYDQNAAAFYVRFSGTGYSTSLNGGQPIFMGDPSHENVPVVGDFDGDGKADLAIYDETAAAFYERNSSSGYGNGLGGGQPIYMGSSNQTNIPIVGDFDGDGRADLSIFDENTDSFYIRYSRYNYTTALNNGLPVAMGDPSHGILPVNALNINPATDNFL